MENTIENKSRFFAQYLGQEILIYEPDPIYKRKVTSYHLDNIQDFTGELTPLSQISDVDANHLGFDSKEDFNKNHTYGDSLEQLKLDYLRSKGYHLPYLDLSKEDQIEYGWVKLKTK